MRGIQLKIATIKVQFEQWELAAKLVIDHNQLSQFELSRQPSSQKFREIRKVLTSEEVRIYNMYIFTSNGRTMITLNELLRETGINRNTLTKYRDLGLIPRPEIVHRGYQKEGQARGNEALYPDYTPWLIREIGRLKAEGYTLSQIRDEIGQIQDINPEEEISEPLHPDSIQDIANAIIAIGRRLDRLTPGYRRVLVEYETSEKEGTLKVVAVWGIQKKLEADSQ